METYKSFNDIHCALENICFTPITTFNPIKGKKIHLPKCINDSIDSLTMHNQQYMQ